MGKFKIVIILNPIAGKGKALACLSSVEDSMRNRVGEYVIEMTEAPGHAIELADKWARRGQCTVVAAGGDGTCNEVINGLLRPEKAESIKFGILPLGDSLIVTEGINRKRVHVHTDDPGEVVSLLRKRGRIVQQKADDMKRQEQIVTAPLGCVGVVTDSIADITGELLDRYQVHIFNMSLIWDNEEYLDRLTITPDRFYQMQAERKSFPGSTFLPPRRLNGISSTFWNTTRGSSFFPSGRL